MKGKIQTELLPIINNLNKYLQLIHQSQILHLKFTYI